MFLYFLYALLLHQKTNGWIMTKETQVHISKQLLKLWNS